MFNKLTTTQISKYEKKIAELEAENKRLQMTNVELAKEVERLKKRGNE